MKDQDFEQKLLEMEIPNPGLISKEEEEIAWKEIMLEMDTGKQRKTSNWWLAAASVAMALFFGWWLLPESENTFATGSNEQLDVQLADRSKVTLNHNSKLSVMDGFDQKDRVVELKGQAFFNIQQNHEKLFIIFMDNRQVKVLGTSFDLKYEAKVTEVLVRTGKVQLIYNDEILTLTSGQKGIISATGNMTREMWDANEIAWYTGALSFEDKTMNEVAKTLTDLHNKPIEVSEEIANCKLTLKIDYERIEEVFDIIAETLDIKWSEEDERIYFDGEGC